MASRVGVSLAATPTITLDDPASHSFPAGGRQGGALPTTDQVAIGETTAFPSGTLPGGDAPVVSGADRSRRTSATTRAGDATTTGRATTSTVPRAGNATPTTRAARTSPTTSPAPEPPPATTQPPTTQPPDDGGGGLFGIFGGDRGDR